VIYYWTDARQHGIYLLIMQFFTITAEIHARSLAYFYCQYADRHMNLKFMGRVSEREWAIRQFVIVKKQTDCQSRGSTATLKML